MGKINNISESDWEKLTKLLLEKQKESKLAVRGEKIRRVMLLLAGGVALTTVLIAPGAAKLLKRLLFDRSNSNWDSWKEFNGDYLKRVVRKLEKQKLVEISLKEGKGQVVLTEKGKKRILEQSVDELSISKPAVWDRKWRIVLYDIYSQQKKVRDHFQKILKNGGFYQLQESVYIHAYPCEEEIEFLRNYLGIAGEARLITAEKIENDEHFRKYFGV